MTTEEPRTPGEVPFCAGRASAAHEPTAMRSTPAGWECGVCGETEPARPTDEQVVAVIAEHLLNVLQAIAATGAVDPDRLVELASKAIADLDQLAAEQAHRPVCASPLHDMTLLAIDRAVAGFEQMRVQTPAAIDGFPLSLMFADAVAAMRSAVEQHWDFCRNGPPRPRLLLPDGTLA